MIRAAFTTLIIGLGWHMSDAPMRAAYDAQRVEARQ